MADVFLSYAREDHEKADHLARTLEAEGVEVFWDNEIPPGSSWADFIEEKLRNSRAMIVLWSAASTASQWVREEARLGRDAGKLIPAVIDGTAPPFGFGEVQAADLTGWDGDPNHPVWKRFITAIRSKIGGEPDAASAAASPFGTAPPSPAPAPQAGFGAAPSGAQGFSSARSAGAAARSGPKPSPFDYILKCLKLYVDGKGRAGRAEFWWFVLFQFVVGFIAGFLDVMLFGAPSFLALAAMAALLAPGIAVTARRLHDFNANGWIAVAAVVPYLGWIATIVIGLIPGKPGENQYGPDPRNPEDLRDVFS